MLNKRHEKRVIPVGTEDKMAPVAMTMPLNSGLCVRGRNVGRWIHEFVFAASDLRKKCMRLLSSCVDGNDVITRATPFC